MQPEQTHYYLIGNEIKKGDKMPPKGTILTQFWKQSLQPCSITDGELVKVKSYLASNTNTRFDLDNHFTCIIEVTDIVEEKPSKQLLCHPPIQLYELVFKQSKSEANEAVEIINEPNTDDYTDENGDWKSNEISSFVKSAFSILIKSVNSHSCEFILSL